MEKDEIKTILEEWNFWSHELYTGIERESCISKLERYARTNQVVVITGARRSGKTIIMRQMAKRLIKEGLEKESILFINFEDPRWSELDAKALQRIYETYLELLNPKQKPCIFLDEVQEVVGWEKWVRMMHELRKAKIFVSGSNAALLEREFSTLLTGRHLDYTVFPLSFREFLLFNNIAISSEIDIISRKVELRRLLREFMEHGAYPEIVLTAEKTEHLLTYFEDIINKDIVKRYKIRKPEKLRILAKFYLSNISSSVTFGAVEKSFGISADTAERFSKYFEDSYLIFFLKRFSFKVKEQEKSPRKVYAIDTGLANAIGFKFSENIGRTAENIVFVALKRMQAANPNIEIFYWKDLQHREVDFVVKEGGNVTKLIQVCWNIYETKVKERETRALLKAMDELGINEGIIITEEKDAEENINGKKIKFVPLLKWLLSEPQAAGEL